MRVMSLKAKLDMGFVKAPPSYAFRPKVVITRSRPQRMRSVRAVIGRFLSFSSDIMGNTDKRSATASGMVNMAV
jgi:hypothetical protein